ncbi:MAG: guanylate kinase [Elusimicrobia bacterium]|nr:guanylate kinase [Elusimicrobiota bacterium]
MTTGIILVVSAPSGAGKSTLCHALLERRPNLRGSISCTTRPPRSGEVNGRDYVFLSETDFLRKINEGALVEWARVHDHLYGTPKDPLTENLRKGFDVVLNIDPQGALSVRKIFPESVLVFIYPPSWGILENRLRHRGQDDEKTMAKRLTNARKEMTYLRHYDYAVVNDRLDEAVDDLLAILRAEHRRTGRLSNELSELEKKQK